MVSKDHRIIASNLVQFSRERGYMKLLPRSTEFRDWTGMKPVEEFSLSLQDLPPHPETWNLTDQGLQDGVVGGIHAGVQWEGALPFTVIG